MDIALRQPVIGLIGLGGGIDVRAEIGAVIDFVLGRNDGRHPVFVGDADPAAGRRKCLGRRADLLEVVILGVYFAVVRHADKAEVENIGRGDIGNALARDIGEGKQGGGLAGLVHHIVRHAKHILFVNADGAVEDKTLTIVPGQRHRMTRRQRRA